MVVFKLSLRQQCHNRYFEIISMHQWITRLHLFASLTQISTFTLFSEFQPASTTNSTGQSTNTSITETYSIISGVSTFTPVISSSSDSLSTNIHTSIFQAAWSATTSPCWSTGTGHKCTVFSFSASNSAGCFVCYVSSDLSWYQHAI